MHPTQADLQQCGIPVAAMTAGGVYVRVGVGYQPLEDPLTEVSNRTIAGFPASVVASGQPQTLGCPPATTTAISITIAPTHLEPAEVDIVACFGGRRTTALHRQLSAMLASAKLATRPPDTTPVRGARPCTSRQISVGLGPEVGGISQTEAILYALRNISSHICSVGGYPTVRLESRTGAVRASYQDGGGQYGNYLSDPRRPSYLRPGGYAAFVISHDICQTGPAVHATTAHIAIPTRPAPKPVTLPVNDRTGVSGLFVCGDESKTIDITPIHGY